MKLLKLCFVAFGLASMLLSFQVAAEDKKIKAEDLVEKVDPNQEIVDLSTKRRARLTEEQAVNQLKYMMVKGWAKIEPDLLESGSFMPLGMVLSPKGEFRPVYIAGQEKLKQEVALAAIAKNLKQIASTRSVWAVGLMYIALNTGPDGETLTRINVLTEHIAGWARHWSYPYKLVDGEIKLGAPSETSIEPFYYSNQ